MTGKTNIFDNQWVDLVFEGRNHAYGAFVLRKKSNDHTLLAFFIAISFCAAIILSPYLFRQPLQLPPEIPTHETVVEMDPPPMIDIPLPQGSTGNRNKEDFAPIIVDKDSVYEEPRDTVTAAVTDPGSGSTGGKGKGFPAGNGGEGKAGDSTGIIPADGPETIVVAPGQMPEFPGGDKALYAFIYDHIRYPAEALEVGKYGKVTVTFVVEKDGTISDIKTGKNRLGWGLEEEAVRVVKLLPKFAPGRQNENPVRVRMAIPINYRIN